MGNDMFLSLTRSKLISCPYLPLSRPSLCGMWINWVVRVLTIGGIAGLPLVLGLPCFCCLPATRKPIATFSLLWGVCYVGGMTVGPRQTATWVAWFFTEMWLTYAVRAGGFLLYWGIKVLGIALANFLNVLVLTLLGWVGWNVYCWLERRKRKAQHAKQH